MASDQSPCCPPNSLPALKFNHVQGVSKDQGKPAGQICNTEAVSYYRTGGDSDKAVLFFPDVWGWHSGRARVLADHFAKELKCVVYIPKLQPQTPEIFGKDKMGADGDGLPEDFNLTDETSAKLVEWVGANDWDKVKPKMTAMMEILVKDKMKHISMTGYCWGAWAIANMCKDYVGTFTRAATAHPSIQLEGAFGRSPEELAACIDIPMLFMPADGDSEDLYDMDKGSIIKVLLKKNRIRDFIEVQYFKDMAHGFFLRGDIAADEKTARDVKAAQDKTVEFLKAGFSYNEDLSLE